MHLLILLIFFIGYPKSWVRAEIHLMESSALIFILSPVYYKLLISTFTNISKPLI
jgi:hypothetical protein